MPFGDSVIPFGLDRLKIVEWLQSLISLKDPTVCIKLIECEIPKLLLTLMKKYDMNSVLHYKIYKIFEETFADNPETACYTEAVTSNGQPVVHYKVRPREVGIGPAQGELRRSLPFHWPTLQQSLHHLHLQVLQQAN